MKIFGLIIFVMFILQNFSFAAGKTKVSGKIAKGNPSGALVPDALGAKAFLEDLLARRYSQELSTIVDSKSFSLGAQLDLIEIPPKTEKPKELEQEPISDLMLGTLDPEELLKKYAVPGEHPSLTQRLLENYRIRTVQINVGLRLGMAPEVKGEVEKWLTERLSSEFGQAGKGVVSEIKAPIEKKGAPNSLIDWLQQFQALIGQMVMALAVILGVLIFALVAKKSAIPEKGEGVTINNTPGSASGASVESTTKVKKEDDPRAIAQEFDSVNKRLRDLVPRIGVELDGVIRYWCQTGEAGKFRLACFAESVSREVGKLPIPVDALSDVSKLFAKMTEVSIEERLEALEKAYWDILTAINLGSEALSQPFGYIGSMKLNMVNEVLIEQNPKMKTLVSLFMPTDLRLRYLKALPLETKRELLTSAAELSHIGADELKSLEKSLKGKLKSEGAAEVIPLEFTLNKLVSALTPTEEVTLLNGMKGAAIDEFKMSTPTLAFVNEWPEKVLARLLATATTDEVVALARVRPDVSAKMLAVAPPMTAEMATEELAMPDNRSDKEKDQFLEHLTARLKNLVDIKEVILEDVFKAEASENTPGQGISNDDQSAA